jgi:hypothetical protein
MTNPRSDYVHLAALRLDWVSAGIDRLEELVDSFLATKPCEVVTGMKREGKYARFSYVVRIHQQPPPAIRFAIGDVVHNLRATLDNLVWGIGQVFKADNNLGLEFHDSESSFRDCYLPKISKLPDPRLDNVHTALPNRALYSTVPPPAQPLEQGQTSHPNGDWYRRRDKYPWLLR